MPFLVPLLPVIAAGIGAAGTAYAAYEGHSTADDQIKAQQSLLQAQQQNQTQQQQNQLAQQQRTALGQAQQFMPNLQAQLGGAVSPDYYAQTSAALTGNANFAPYITQQLAQQGIAPPQGGINSGLLPSLSGTTGFSGAPPAQTSGLGDLSSLFGNLGGGGQFHGGSA